MNKFALSKHKFAFIAAGILAAAGLYLLLIAPNLTHMRRQWAANLAANGAEHLGTTRVAWYELAHTLTPRDPAIGLSLAQSYQAIGNLTAARQVLSRYPQYVPAVALQGQISVQEGQFSQALAVLRPAVGKSSDVAYWDAQAQAEQGSASTAWGVLQPYLKGGSTRLVLLYDYLRLASGQTANAPLTSSEAVQGLTSAEQGKYQLAVELYRLRLLNTAERVLAAGNAPSPANWNLRAEIATSRQPAAWSVAEADYWQALILDPTDEAVKTQLAAAAKRLHDTAMLARITQQQAQLPVR